MQYARLIGRIEGTVHEVLPELVLQAVLLSGSYGRNKCRRSSQPPSHFSHHVRLVGWRSKNITVITYPIYWNTKLTLSVLKNGPDQECSQLPHGRVLLQVMSGLFAFQFPASLLSKNRLRSRALYRRHSSSLILELPGHSHIFVHHPRCTLIYVDGSRPKGYRYWYRGQLQRFIRWTDHFYGGRTRHRGASPLARVARDLRRAQKFGLPPQVL